MIRVPFLMCPQANTPRPCTGELRTSTSGEVTIGGPPRFGCGWLDMSIFFVLRFMIFLGREFAKRPRAP